MFKLLRLILTVIAGLFLALVIVAVSARILMNKSIAQEAAAVLSSAVLDQADIVQMGDLQELPPCVQKWLESSGVVGKPKIHTVRLTQTGRMRLEPGKPWAEMKAVQYINLDNPGFVWKAGVKIFPLVDMTARDKYYQGQGSMLVKLLGLIKVVDAQPGPEMNQSAMLRFLAEMIWYPGAALNDYIKWEGIDEHSARAVMSWQGTSASMVFYFDEGGDMYSSTAPRYQEVNGSFVLRDWGGVAREYREFHGIRISNKTDVIWKYPVGDFNWLQIEITGIEYNQTL